MTDTSKYFCSLCQEDDVTSTAIAWCHDCRDFLCSECFNHHRRSKLSKKHKTIDTEGYRQLRPFVLSISNRCQEHQETFELFCCAHGKPCCVKCLVDIHKNCTNIRPISDALANIKNGPAFLQIENDLENLRVCFDKILDHTENRIGDVSIDFNTTNSSGLQTIKSARKLMNGQFDEVEEIFVKTMEGENGRLKAKLEELKETTLSKQSKVETMMDDVKNMHEFATDVQMFLALKELETAVAEQFAFVQKIKTGDQLTETNVTFKMHQFFNSLASDVSFIGKICFDSKSSNLKLTTGKEVVGQLPMPVLSENKKPKKICRTCSIILNKPENQNDENIEITGCSILPTGELIFVDKNNKCLLLYTSDGFYDKTIPRWSFFSSDTPFDITYVHKDIVAITTLENKLRFIDYKVEVLKKVILLKGKCDGVDKEDERLYVRLSDDNTFLILDLEGNYVSSFRFQGRYMQYLSVFNGYIYCTNNNQSKVYCLNNTGDLMWNKYISGGLRGLAVDLTGLIYCISSRYNDYDHLTVLSSDGNESEEISLDEPELHCPYAIHIERSKSLLLICSKTEPTAFLYKL